VIVPALPWTLFAPDAPIFVARAPARLDVMGGIADYSGATVLQLPLALGAVTAAQATTDGLLHAHTSGPGVPAQAHDYAAVTLPLSLLTDGPPALAPERLRAALSFTETSWAAYLLGPFAILYAAGLTPPFQEGDGLRLVLWSDVPPGAGISSSAALEVASLRAVAALYRVEIDGLRLAALAQEAEHRVAGAPCGIMDQATAALGRAGRLLALRCQEDGEAPATVLDVKPLPRDAVVFGIDSAVAHRVAGTQYGRVRTAAFMGRALIAALDPSDPPGGYLCNIDPARFKARYEGWLPQEMSGAAFLSRYGGTGDAAAPVDPTMVYAVRDCTAHPIYEQANIQDFLHGLDRYSEDGRPAALSDAGAAMTRSHESYDLRCGLGSPETSTIARLVREAGPARGLHGARITGGGAGGTVAILGAGPQAREAVDEVAAAYTAASGHQARVIAGSGDGALATRVERVRRDAYGGVRTL